MERLLPKWASTDAVRNATDQKSKIPSGRQFGYADRSIHCTYARHFLVRVTCEAEIVKARVILSQAELLSFHAEQTSSYPTCARRDASSKETARLSKRRDLTFAYFYYRQCSAPDQPAFTNADRVTKLPGPILRLTY